jgi:hypothetical protein
MTMDERFLQDEEPPVDGNDFQVLLNTCILYGGIFLFILIAFCYLRRRFPGAYNLRSWIEGNETELAKDQYGFISWMWKLSTIGDSEFLEEAGMDALCFTRVLELGVKLSLFGSLNALWLMPVYATAEESRETDYIKDPILKLTVSHVPSGSLRFVATVVAAYFIYIYTMYCILQEFKVSPSFFDLLEFIVSSSSFRPSLLVLVSSLKFCFEIQVVHDPSTPVPFRETFEKLYR